MSFGRIDVHAHLLPGIDDGCSSVDESIACAKLLVGAGYSHAFCTPHIWPSFPKNTPGNIRMWTNDLQGELDAAKIPLKLIPGGEHNLVSNWPALRQLPPAELVTYAMAGKYLLFDFWAAQAPAYLPEAVAYLRSLDITPILAHPERIVALNSVPDAIDRVMEKGLLLQMNTWCLTGPLNSPIRLAAERWLLEGRYFLFGTDTHNSDGMGVRLGGLSAAEQLIGVEKVDELTRVNPRKLCGDVLPENW